MASNRELAAKAAELGEALGRDVVNTDGLNNQALTALVEELQSAVDARAAAAPQPVGDELSDTMPATPSAKHAAEEPETVAELVADAPAPAEPPAVSSSEPTYVIAPGRSLTSLRDILDAGTAVTARDFLHGQETLDHLVEVGAVLKS